jgi:Ca2+-binding EF-hand superfamily protein
MMKRILWLALMVSSPLAMATESAVTPQSSAAETPFERDFSKADTDMNGALSRAEAEGAKAQLLTVNFDKIDANGDGELDRKEIQGFLQTAMQNAMQAQQEEFLRRLKAADKNKNGKLTKKELASAKEKDKLPGLEKNFDAIDANRDKSITMEEISAYAKANQQ